MKKIITLALVFVLLLFFGCTISVNPQDLAPSKNYTVVTDINNNLSSNNSQGTISKLVLDSVEVAKHSVSGNCWMILNGNVYDLSVYVSHPGGSGYLIYCGKEATNGYDTKGGRGNGHSSYADSLLANYLIGQLGQTVVVNDINNSVNPNVPPYYGDEDEFEEDD